MRENFASSLAAVLQHEGGYVNDPQDPGGATNRGVTQAVYDDYRSRLNLPRQSVKLLSSAETEAIYRERYWDAIRGDDLPAGVDYCTFDFAVNSGVSRAARFLQRAVGVADDGKIGPMTLAAARAADQRALIANICCARQSFLQGLSTFARFGRGWTARVAQVQAAAVGMA